MSPSLEGKRALIFGVASETSIAWGIAQELAKHGVKCTMGYQKRFLSRVMNLFKDQDWIEGWHECDVAKEASVKSFFEEAGDGYDMMVHCIAYAPAEALGDEITKTTEEDYNTALSVSAYSLVRLTNHALPNLNDGAGILALTYLGADRVVPGYRVMGTAKAALQELTRELSVVCGQQKQVRVNCISAGPIRTLAASGVPGFDNILDWMKHSAPLKRNVTQEDVGKAARFLLSDDASGITGQTLYVDAGYSITGVPPDLDQITLPGQEPKADAEAEQAPAREPERQGHAKPLVFGRD